MTLPNSAGVELGAERAPRGDGSIQLVQDSQDLDTMLSGILRELGTDEGLVALSRQTRTPPIEWEHLARIPLADFSPDYVQTHYGGGRYRAKFKRGGGTYLGHASFAVAGPPRALPQFPGDGAGSYPVGGPSPELVELRELVRLTAQSTSQLIAAMAQRPQADPFDTALKIAEVARALHPPAPASDPVQLLTQMRETMQLARELADDRGSDGLGETFTKFALPLVQAFTARGEGAGEEVQAPARPQLPAHARVHTPTPAAVQVQPAAAPTPMSQPVTDGPAWVAGLRPFVPQLLALARAQKDPELYAEVLLDQIPAPYVALIQEQAQLPAFVEIVTGAVPELEREHREWWTKLVTAARDLLTAAEGDEP